MPLFLSVQTEIVIYFVHHPSSIGMTMSPYVGIQDNVMFEMCRGGNGSGLNGVPTRPDTIRGGYGSNFLGSDLNLLVLSAPT